jgi:hypothetical protein
LDRFVAVNILKEMQDKIPKLSPQSVTLIKAKSNEHLSKYALHFTGLCDECKKQVIKIANEYNLAIKEQSNEITLYSKINPQKSKIS